MTGEFDRDRVNRPAAVIHLRQGREGDFFSFLTAFGVTTAPRPLGSALYLVFFPPGVEVNAFLLKLAAAVISPPPGLRLELVETRMAAVDPGAETIVCGEFFLVSPGPGRPGAGEIVLAPGIGFGSGAHASTRLAMAMLARAMSELRPETVLDAGCGSGILSLAAAGYAAARVVAVELEPRAAAEAGENVVLNHLGDIITVKNAGVEEVDGRFDLVIANMTPAVLKSLAPRLAAMTVSALIVSGIQGRQVDEFSAVFSDLGFGEAGRDSDGAWGALILIRQARRDLCGQMRR